MSTNRGTPPRRFLALLKKVVWMQRSGIQGSSAGSKTFLHPDSVALHPGYICSFPSGLKSDLCIPSCLSILLMCASCGFGTSGMDELRDLCEKDAGLKIYKTVEADGFYDATGSSINLIESDYQFLEYCDDHPDFTRAIPEPGCWRMRKVKRESGQCYERLDKRISKFIVDPYPEFLKDHCVAAEKIEKPEAEYRYEVENKEWWLNEQTGTKMTSGQGRIVNNKTEEVIGIATNYVLFPKWYGSGRSHPSIHCGSPHVTGQQQSMPFATGLIEKTLVPRTDNEKGELK